jgi:hypothetical protein
MNLLIKNGHDIKVITDKSVAVFESITLEESQYQTCSHLVENDRVT